MVTDKVKACALVSIQVVSLALILWTGRPWSGCILLLILQIAGALLGIWAIATMGMKNTSIGPLIRPGASLVTGGPYAFIRHPMYSAVLLTIWPLIIDQYSPLRLSAALILTVDLCIKMAYEESRLRKHFSGYESYMRKTKRLIPFVL